MLKEGTDVTLVASGLTVNSAIEAAEMLEKDGIHARVINIHTIKPLDEEIIIQAAKEQERLLQLKNIPLLEG